MGGDCFTSPFHSPSKINSSTRPTVSFYDGVGRNPELDGRNAVQILKADADNWTGIDESAGYGISREDVGRFLRYLGEIKFVSWPSGRGRALPEVDLSAAQMQAVGAVGGRGGVSK